MPSASEMARVEEEQQPAADAETLAELQARAKNMGFGSASHALDHLAEVLRGEL